MIIYRRRRILAGLALSLGALIISACSAPEKFTAHYWPTPGAGELYPEQQAEEFRKGPSFGVAFQGGGNRAAPAALGQLRALHHLNWIDKVQYISAISGGSWTAIPYTYLKKAKCGSEEATKEACEQKQKTTDDFFLGEMHAPKKVVKRIVAIKEAGLGKEFSKGTMLHAMENAAITANYLSALFGYRMDEAYSDALAKIYLKPFGLGRTLETDPDSLFTWREEDRQRIRENSRFANTEIHIVERDRPYLIVGGSVLTRRIDPNQSEKFLMEMTPLYSGVPWKMGPNEKVYAKVPLGGGYVESYGYDYLTNAVEDAPESKTLGGVETDKILTLRDPIFGNLTNRSRLNFSLSNVAAISGAAPVETIISLPVVNLLFSNMGFPEHYVPTDQVLPKRLVSFAKEGVLYEKEWAHGDGGHEDNLGLVSLLERRVQNIIVFANSYAPLGMSKSFPDENGVDGQWSMIDRCKNELEKYVIPADFSEDNLKAIEDRNKALENCVEMAGDDLPTFFTKTKASVHNAGLTMLGRAKYKGEHDDLRGFYDLLALAEELEEKRLVSCKRYSYSSQLDVSRGNVPPDDYQPNICIIFLGMDEAWKNEIIEEATSGRYETDQIKDIREALDFTDTWGPAITKRISFGSNGFPHLGTFRDKRARVIKTRPERLYALSNFVAWKLNEHREEIDAFFEDLELNK